MWREEGGAGVFDADKAGAGHFEEADFVGGAETVLDGAEEAEGAAFGGFEVEDGIDEVLEEPWACDFAAFGDVAGDEGGGAGAFGEGEEAGAGFGDLGGATGARFEAFDGD